MRILLAVAAIAAAPFAVPVAQAQDSDTSVATPAAAPATAPDGTRAFGIEPYIGILGGYERFDRQSNAGIPIPADGRAFDGGLIQGVAGINVPLGPVFVGAEGNVAKGIKGDIDWEYGAAGRFGLRAGESGLIYGKVGYQWVNFDALGKDSRDYHAMTYGAGVEVGPKDIGLGGVTGNSGVRLRMEINTFNNAKSFRPMAGLIAHF
ncbi:MULTISPECIES: opacity protein [unclassified Sphingomonas]|jgi:outer membrane immunogenic protein|uniref:opacity protein n=3 Tax=Pseudomonadota TaxID=1224 RepID=UPI000AF87B29|nr:MULTISPECIES: opacity protein [unclassified Sphingomonas]